MHESMKIFGWTNRIARIDLGSGSIEIEPIDERWRRMFLGGRGLCVFHLVSVMEYAYHDPGMPVCIFAGPLTGTPALFSSRVCFASRSPLTGCIGDSSAGGRFGVFLKRAGLDGIIITGRAGTPKGIVIDDGRISIVDASGICGMTTSRAAAMLGTEGGLALCGPAAFEGVLFANIMVDGDFAAGRTGIGRVFAAKNLVFIKVSGKKKVHTADPAGLREANRQIMRLVSASPILSGRFGIGNFGTPAIFDLTDARAMMPTENFRRSKFPGARMTSPHALRSLFNPVKAGCFGCPVKCKKKDSKGRGLPEFETLSHFTALVGNADIREAVYANRLCNEYGIDTISAASVIALHLELTGGFPPKPGMVADLVEKIGLGQGIGRDLGVGAARYAARIDAPGLAMAVKGLDLPAYDPRGAYGMALGYAVSTRGGCHLRSYPISHEILRKPVPTDRFSFEGKARIIKQQEEINAVADSLTACKFAFLAAGLEEYATALSAVTGLPYVSSDLSLCGERVIVMERMANMKAGIGPEKDMLPQRFFTEHSGDLPPIDPEEFSRAKKAYYRLRGLDESGNITQKTLARLGIKDLWNG